MFTQRRVMCRALLMILMFDSDDNVSHTKIYTWQTNFGCPTGPTSGLNKHHYSADWCTVAQSHACFRCWRWTKRSLVDPKPNHLTVKSRGIVHSSKFCRALTLIKILARTLSSLSWATCVKPLTAYWRYHRYVTTFRIIDRRRCSSNPVTNNKKPNRNPNRNPNPNPTTIPAPPSTTILTPKGFQIHFGHWSFHIFQNDFIAIWYETMASFCFHRRSFTR